MAGAHLAAVYTSDLARAAETALAVAAGGPGAPITTPGLREVSVGEWEGFTRERLEQEYPTEYAAWRALPSWDLVPGGEGLQPFVERTRATVSEILTRHAAADQPVALVTHIGVIRLLLSMALGLPADDTRWRWAVRNTSITAVDTPPDFAQWEAGAASLLAVNDSAHLEDVA
ncbi:MAG: alpha-ribazole phosphatase [Chloroflexota bacterium]|nr:alpha-ribazole phosphatase [Chloroflexota bacterium]